MDFAPQSVQPVMNLPGITATNDGPQNEDCLYLNIWTPKEALLTGKKLPVYVVIHGGGFYAFSGAVPVLQGHELAKKGIVVVTINYRLGALGFLAHPELSAENPDGVSGNYGILDQIEALRWVQKNIAFFGGDPSQVTVSGESAGAFSVSVLCMSPLAKGLFQRATAQSGGFFDKKTVMYQLMDLKQAEAAGAELTMNKPLKELREMSPQTILEMTAAKAPVYFIPIQDDFVFPVDTEKAFRDHICSDVPLLVGSNKDDGSKFVPRNSDPHALQKLGETLVGEERIGAFLNTYPNDTPEETEASLIQLFSDSAFGHNSYVWANLQKKHGTSSVYLYYYCHIPPETEYGSYHSSELAYFHHNLCNVPKNWRPVDYMLEEAFSTYVLNFVKTGDPNGNKLPHWDPFASDTKQITCLDEVSGMIVNPTLAAMNLWDSIMSN